MSAPLEAVVVRQLAGLRRANWSLGAALEFVEAELPPSALKRRLHEALGSVRAGAAPASADLLVATLTRGDAASGEVLEQLAEALEAGEAARSATTTGRVVMTVVLCVCALVVLRFTGGFVSSFTALYADFGAELPVATRLFIELSGPLQVATPLALVAALALVWRAQFGGVAGGRELRASSLLLQFASALEAGVDEPRALALIDAKAPSLPRSDALALDATERLFLGQVTASAGSAEAARRLGAELRGEGARRAAEGRWWASPGLVAALLVTALFAASALLAMYLPIFSLAGGIQ